MDVGLSQLREAASRLAESDPAAVHPSVLAERVVELRALIDGLEGTWLGLVAAVDRSGPPDGGTSAWLRSACRISPATARSRVTWG